MNKRGLQLSINFIVMLILAIVVFGFGLFFVNKLFGEVGEIKAELDAQTEQRIESLLSRGEKVAFPISNRDTKAGSIARFGLGILNVEDTGTFKVELRCTIALDRQGNDFTTQGGCDGPWTFDAVPDPVPRTTDVYEIDPYPFELVKNDQKIIPIIIQVPGNKPKGTYGFTVTVQKDNVPYAGVAPQQIYVNVD